MFGCLVSLKKRDFFLHFWFHQEDNSLIFKLFTVPPNNTFGGVWKQLSDRRLKLLQGKDGILLPSLFF